MREIRKIYKKEKNLSCSDNEIIIEKEKQEEDTFIYDPKNIRGFYTGCVNSGNLGDDILFKIFIFFLSHVISQKYKTHCKIQKSKIQWSKGDDWLKTCKIGVIGGGSIIHPEEVSYTIGLLNNNKTLFSKLAFGTGISDSPNFKIPYINKQELLNEKTEKIDFPVNDLMKINIKAIQECNLGGLRGPLDINIAKSIDENFNKKYIYDPGILVSSLLNYRNNKESKNIGINLAEISGDNRISLLKEGYVQYMNRINELFFIVCNWLLEKNYNIIFYSMGYGDLPLHKNLVKRLKSVNPDYKISVRCFSNTNFKEIKKFTSNLKFCIATRLHANILINSFNIPTICLAYNIKSLNYMKSINCSELMIPTNSKMNVNNVQKKITLLEKNYGDYVNRLETHTKKSYSIYYNEFCKMLIPFRIGEKEKIEIYYDIVNNIYGAYQIKIKSNEKI